MQRGLTGIALRRQQSHSTEEPLVQHLKQLQRRLVNVCARAARVHQRHVYNRGVVVARILSAKTTNCGYLLRCIVIWQKPGRVGGGGLLQSDRCKYVATNGIKWMFCS